MAAMSNSIDLNNDFGSYFSVAIDDVEVNSDVKQVVFTFYPKAEKFEHYHIELSKDAVNRLYELLGKYLHS